MLLLYCINQPISSTIDLEEIIIAYQSSPSSSPSPLVAQLPLTLHSLPFSCPAKPSLSLISPGLNAPSTSCLFANTRTGTDFNSSSDNIVRSSERDVGSREASEESIT